MSRRRSLDQPRRRDVPGSPRPARAPLPPSAPRPSAPAPHPVYRALLPLRFFLGGMFLYAGIDKLVDPSFLAATGPGSIGEQLAGFTHVSLLAPLIEVFALPWPVAVGLGVALLEIAVGLGALAGILYRASAAVGAALSLLFFLTASWDTRPIYYGADIPYMVGWATLVLAGSGGLYVVEDRLLARLRRAPLPAALADDGTPASAGRRAVLEMGALAGGAVAVAVAGRAFGRLLGPVFAQEAAVAPAGSPRPTPTPAAGGAAAPESPAATTPGSGGSVAAASPVPGEIADSATMAPRSAAAFVLANGDPGIVVKLADGKVVAYDATCTHEGCPVGYDPTSGLLACPCHGAMFDPADAAAAVAGPTRVPLTPVPISIDPATGAVTVTG